MRTLLTLAAAPKPAAKSATGGGTNQSSTPRDSEHRANDERENFVSSLSRDRKRALFARNFVSRAPQTRLRRRFAKATEKAVQLWVGVFWLRQQFAQVAWRPIQGDVDQRRVVAECKCLLASTHGTSDDRIPPNLNERNRRRSNSGKTRGRSPKRDSLQRYRRQLSTRR